MTLIPPVSVLDPSLCSKWDNINYFFLPILLVNTYVPVRCPSGAYVTNSCSPCREDNGQEFATLIRKCEEKPHPPSIFSFMSVLSFFGMEINGERQRCSLSLPGSRCLCNLHTGLQSATEPLFIRLILKSTFCRPRKRLAKL